MVKFIKNKTLSVEEMENLGWLKRPTAKEYFLANPKLTAKYASYDDFAFDRHSRLAAKWRTARAVVASSSSSEGQGASSSEKSSQGGSGGLSADIIDYSTSSLSYDFNPALNKVSNAPKTKITQDKTTYPSTEGVEVTRLKSKKKKKNNNYRITNKVCPSCLSTLKLTELGVWACTQDRMQIWEKEFARFSRMGEKQQEKFLNLFSHPEKFKELYDKWNYKDETGKRVNFECDYSNKLFNPVSRFRTVIPDPALVRTIEKSLGRKLTEEEILGEDEIWQEGKVYFTTYKKGRRKVKIPKLTFPDAFF